MAEDGVSEEVALLREQLTQVREDMARQKSEYVQKIRDIEARHAEESAMTGAVDADDVQDAAEFEAQCDMLELSLADKSDKLNAANASIEALKGDLCARDEESEALRAELAAQALQLAEQQAKADEAARELEANTKLTRQCVCACAGVRA
jgi:hypothetical protein